MLLRSQWDPPNICWVLFFLLESSMKKIMTENEETDVENREMKPSEGLRERKDPGVIGDPRRKDLRMLTLEKQARASGTYMQQNEGAKEQHSHSHVNEGTSDAICPSSAKVSSCGCFNPDVFLALDCYVPTHFWCVVFRHLQQSETPRMLRVATFWWSFHFSFNYSFLPPFHRGLRI